MLNKVKVEIIKLKTSKQIDKIWIAGHNVIASDMLVLYAQCKHEMIVFGDYLRSPVRHRHPKNQDYFHAWGLVIYTKSILALSLRTPTTCWLTQKPRHKYTTVY